MKTINFHLIGFLLINAVATAQSWSQPQFSVNVVGYVDVNFLAGSNLFANPLNASDNSIAGVLRGLPDGSVYLPWNRSLATFPVSNVFQTVTGWSNPNEALVMPHAGFLWLPSDKTISFAGDPQWVISNAVPCYSYPLGLSVTVLPVGFCGTCDFGPCPPGPGVPDDTIVCRWNRSRRAFECYTYYSFLGGWLDEFGNVIDLQLSPGEAARIDTSQTFNARLPNTISGGVTSGPPSVTLRDVQHANTNLSFRFPAEGSVSYTVLRATNLNSNSWSVAVQEFVQATNGFITVTAPATANGMSFYKLGSVFPQALLFNAVRTNSQFQFQFYGVSGTNYTVQRQVLLGEGPWQDVTTASGTGGLITVTDVTATGSKGYYRLQY